MPITPIRAQSIINEEGIPVEYPLDPPHDIEWSAGFNEWSDVAAAFNYGRESENTLLGSALGEIVLPSADSWMAMSDGEKALWLINEERSARGLALLQGLEANVNAVAQSYAEWLLENNEFDHEADGRSPWERLDANASIAACHDFLAIAENLYLAATTSEDDIPFVVEQSIYRMIYDDASSLWGHRHAILWAAYTENSGATDREGFVGVGHAHGVYINPFDKRLYQNTDIIVLNFFDPCATWEGTTPVERTTPTPTATATPVSSPTPTVSPTPVPTSTPTPQPERSVSGRVTIPAGAAIEQRGSGIAGVTITSEDGLTTQTNANGEFVLQGLSAAKHTLTPSKEGYSFFPAVIEVDLTTYNFDGISFMGVSGPAGTELSFSLHLPYIDRD